MFFSRRPRTEEFEAVALPHLNDLYRTAARLGGDAAVAGDVVQDVVLQAWKSFDRFDAGTNCRAGLFKILSHSLQHYRPKWMNVRMIKDTEQLLEQAPAGCPPPPEHVTD